MKETERMLWRCRRGLLELDIVLARFVEQHYSGLDAAGQRSFGELLDMPDTVLWDMITDKIPAPQDAGLDAILELLKTA